MSDPTASLPAEAPGWPTVEEIGRAVDEIAAQFAAYTRQHLAKDPPQYEKANVNTDFLLKAEWVRRSIDALQPQGASLPAEGWVTCETCQGNGEIVTDWERYREPADGDKGDEATADCPDCDGTGQVAAAPPAPAGLAGRETHEFDIRERDATDPPPEAGGKELRDGASVLLELETHILAAVSAYDSLLARNVATAFRELALALALSGASQP